MDVSVVIPVLNGAETIDLQLRALRAQDFQGEYEVIVADNGSTDGTRDIVAEHVGPGSPVRLADASLKQSANFARNVGFQAARGEKILFCDADDEVVPGWITAMARGLDDGDAVGGALDFARLNPHLSQEPARSAVFWEGGTPFAVTACAGWRRAALEELGGFDDSWRSGSDDIEVALRAARLGHRVVEAPEALVHKRERPVSRALWKQYYRYGRSRARLIKEHPEAERRSTRAAARQWSWLASQVLRGRIRDWTVLRRIAHNCGRLAGSVEYRTWAP